MYLMVFQGRVAWVEKAVAREQRIKGDQNALCEFHRESIKVEGKNDKQFYSSRGIFC